MLVTLVAVITVVEAMAVAVVVVTTALRFRGVTIMPIQKVPITRAWLVAVM